MCSGVNDEGDLAVIATPAFNDIEKYDVRYKTREVFFNILFACNFEVMILIFHSFTPKIKHTFLNLLFFPSNDFR